MECEEEKLASKSETEMETKLMHQPRKIRRTCECILRNSRVVPKSLYDLRPSDVPIRHHFELKIDALVYWKGRRKSRKHNRMNWEVPQKMIKAFIIVSSSS